MLKKIAVLITLLMLSSVAVANDSPFTGSIAIEYQTDAKFSGIIGKIFLTEHALEVSTFTEQNGKIHPHSFIYKIIERKYTSNGLYNIKCTNQLGSTFEGSIDTKKYRIFLSDKNNNIITNISTDGLKMKKKYLPKFDLGQ